MGQVQLLNRSPYVNGIPQKDFLGFGIGGEFYRKCISPDGDDDILKTSAIARDTIRSAITGDTFPTTFYMEVTPLVDADGTNIATLGIFKAGGADTDSRIYVGIRRNGDYARVVIITEAPGGSAVLGSYTSTIAFAVGTKYYIAIPFTSTTVTSNTAYISNGTTTQNANLAVGIPGSLTAPSQLDNVNHVIGMQIIRDDGVEDCRACIIHQVAIFPQNYTIAQCQANIASAPFRLKCNDGQGDELTNSGTAGTDFNMNLYNTTAENFFKLCKE